MLIIVNRMFHLTFTVMIMGMLFFCMATGADDSMEGSTHEIDIEETGDSSTTGAITLDVALDLVLRENPSLAAFSWDIRAADARVLQAGLRPNPKLMVEVEGVRWESGPSERSVSTSISGGLESGTLSVPSISREWEHGQRAHSGISESEFTISIAQPIKLGRKRAKQMAVAERQKELLFWDYQAARADVLAKTASDFVEVLSAQEQVELEKELVDLAAEIVQTFSLRVEAGQVSPLELSRAEVAHVTTQIAYQDSFRKLEAARAVLASNWGSNRAIFENVIGRLDVINPVPEIEEIEAQLNRNPDLARWATELSARESEFKLERSKRIPDLTVKLGLISTGLPGSGATSYGLESSGGLGFTRSKSGSNEGRDNSLVLGFSLPLPLFNRNQGNIAAAEAMISKVSEQQRGAKAKVYSELTSAHQTASGAYTEIKMLQDEVMPKVDETFKKIQQGYQQGKFSYLEVLDTQRTLFNAREAFLNALTQYHKGVVRMERLTGQALEEHNTKKEIDIKETNHDE